MKLYTANAPAYWTTCAALGVFAAAVFGVLHGLLKDEVEERLDSITVSWKLRPAFSSR